MNGIREELEELLNNMTDQEIEHIHDLLQSYKTKQGELFNALTDEQQRRVLKNYEASFDSTHHRTPEEAKAILGKWL